MKKQKKVTQPRVRGMRILHQNYRLTEYRHFDGECTVTFNIVSIDFLRETVTLAITNRGKISVVEYDLFPDEKCEPYFEYGPDYTRIYVNEFEV